MNISNEELKVAIDIAGKATPGPWIWDADPWEFDPDEQSPWLVQVENPSNTIITGDEDGCCALKENAVYVAQMNPQFAISIMQELIKLREENARLKSSTGDVALSNLTREQLISMLGLAWSADEDNQSYIIERDKQIQTLTEDNENQTRLKMEAIELYGLAEIKIQTLTEANKIAMETLRELSELNGHHPAKLFSETVLTRITALLNGSKQEGR